MSEADKNQPQQAADEPTERFGDGSNAALDAQAALVMKKGFLDDAIDGIQLGGVTILLLSFFIISILGSSLPIIFPVTKPVYSFVVGIPDFFLGIPGFLVAVWDNLPTSPEAALQLFASVSEAFRQCLHEVPYKECVLFFSWATYLWEANLDVRQRDRLHEVRRPLAISSFVSRQAYLEANAYGLDKSSLELVKNLVSQIQTSLIIAYDAIPWLWNVSGSLLENTTGYSGEIARSLVFFVAATLISTVLSLPFDMYSTFVVERKHGFNKQTIGLFVSDLIKTLLLTVVLGSPVLALFLWVIGKTGSQFYLYAWALLAVVQLIVIAVYPTFIQPLFNKFDPLPEGELRVAIEALASRLGFPLKKLYVVDGSKRSSHSNAYVFGFFKSKRIVVFDTLISQCTTEEIVAIIGHELGHWKRNHILRMLMAIQIQTFIIFFTFSLFIGEVAMYQSFGFSSTPVLIGFMLFQYLYQPLDSVLSFCTNVLSRTNEFEADAFSKKLGYGEQLRSGLIKLQIENKGNMNPDYLYSAYHYSHPPLVERLNALNDPNVAPKIE